MEAKKTFELREMNGNLFRNNRKTNETQADFTGRIMINGQIKFISAWVKASASGGDNYISFVINEPQEKQNQIVPEDQKNEFLSKTAVNDNAFISDKTQPLPDDVMLKSEPEIDDLPF